MSKLDKVLKSAAGNAAGDAPNVEDVFSTYLYTSSTNDRITNNIDLDGEGGLVWIKDRESSSLNHYLYNTEITGNLHSNTTDALDTFNGVSFHSDGFTDGMNFNSGNDYVSWTFRKAPRFFDVVTYTGNGTAGREIAHDLGCEVGMMCVKRTDSAKYWAVYHTSNGNTGALKLDDTVSFLTGNFWDSTSPTSTQFTVGTSSAVNVSGGTYVAYLFAHDPDGEDDDGMIACGSYSGTGSVGNEINLGWEPQYILLKNATSGGDSWFLVDSMRGITSGGDDSPLRPNLSGNEYLTNQIALTSTGFILENTDTITNSSGKTYIYMAIRAPMMVEPEAGTEVFDNVLLVDGSTDKPAVNASFNSPDLAISADRDSNYGIGAQSRDRLSSNGKSYFNTASTAAEADYSAYTDGFSYLQKGIDGANAGSTFNMGGSGTIYWMFKRAKGFFDVVAYTGNGTAGRTVNHSLGVAPEIIIVKARTGSYARQWFVYDKFSGATKRMSLDDSSIPAVGSFLWNDTEPTDSVFSVAGNTATNGSGTWTYIAYLFATLAGVSKVGSFTGNGSSQNIACGFSGGARFVLIKRTDSSGDWYTWDTERGIVSGNDPHLSLNSTSAEVTSDDSIDPQSAGFTVNQVSATNINVTSATYIFLAIA